MWHQHFKHIDSTQIHLRHNLALYQQKAQAILISATRQDGGIGQYGHHWHTLANALSFSCTIDPAWIPKTSLPLSIILGLGLIEFLKSYQVLHAQLKWPNDIVIQGRKCGGILVEQHHATYIAGLGLNWGKILPEENITFAPLKNYVPLPAGPIFPEKILAQDDYKTLPAQIYQYWLDFLKDSLGQLTANLALTLHHAPWWQKGGLVQVALAENKIKTGIFNGVTPEGAAIIDDEKIYTGSLQPIEKGPHPS
ncbi:MAG: biotin--[acetyl-CoA-carboxylase] ligase [Bacteriovoracaceae bacterium]|nr:biotin--[acetyl-CoA-carboxylase] ligase [Bacteriovoracaceae bacterium]